MSPRRPGEYLPTSHIQKVNPAVERRCDEFPVPGEGQSARHSTGQPGVQLVDLFAATHVVEPDARYGGNRDRLSVRTESQVVDGLGHRDLALNLSCLDLRD